LTEALQTARTSASTKAVVLRVNSPGGSAAASEAMWRAVERTAAEKPVIVSMGDVAASGGYYIAAGADSIVAAPTTTTGSIGVFGLVVNAEGFFENQLGVTFDGVQTSPYADLFSPTTPLTENERRVIGTSIDQTYQTFLQRVADARGMDVEAVNEVAQGRVWSGRDAEEVGLVDTTGSLADAVAMAGTTAGLGDGPYRTRILPRPKTFVERLAGQFAAQARQAWRSITMNALERQFWQKKQVLDRAIGSQDVIQTRLPFRPTIE
jgi:protease-4